MTPEAALAAIAAASVPGKAADMLAYHKVSRRYLGVPNPVLNQLTTEWRQALPLAERLSLARGLWHTDVFEARIAAAKLLTQARIRPDVEVWETILAWVPAFDSWAIADHVSKAGERRLLSDPARLDEVEIWVASEHMWSRRAALVMTLPWTKQNHPSAAETLARDRVLGWAARLTDDRDWFIQKAIGWWLRTLSAHDPERVRVFLDAHGSRMKAFARREATRNLR